MGGETEFSYHLFVLQWGGQSRFFASSSEDVKDVVMGILRANLKELSLLGYET
jgi:hypothetical protein